MFMMFHANDWVRPWLIALAASLLAAGAIMFAALN